MKCHCVLFPYSCFLHGCVLGGRHSGGHLVSLPRRARLLGPATPRRPRSSRRSPNKHPPRASERAGRRQGRPERPGPRGGDSTRTKVREAHAPPGASRRGAPGRRLPQSAALARPPEPSPPGRPAPHPRRARGPLRVSSGAGFRTQLPRNGRPGRDAAPAGRASAGNSERPRRPAGPAH